LANFGTRRFAAALKVMSQISEAPAQISGVGLKNSYRAEVVFPV
jgi:hypothetical protein